MTRSRLRKFRRKGEGRRKEGSTEGWGYECKGYTAYEGMGMIEE